MKIGIASDHRGFKQKAELKSHLEKLNYEVIDYGAKDGDTTDYPHFAFLLSEKAVAEEIDLGILICGTGIGMSIASNKVQGARCAKVDDDREAVLAKTHNNANLISLSSEMKMSKMKKLTELFIEAKYMYDERHNKRLAMIAEYENDN